MRPINDIRKAPIVDFLSSLKLPYDVISLGQGIPFFRPPSEAVEKVVQNAGNDTGYRYSEDAGFLSARKVISEKLVRENNITTDPSKNIIITSGANQAFLNALIAISDVGDEIIFFTPTYFNYIMATEMVGRTPVLVPTDAMYQPDIFLLKKAVTKRTKAVVTISPNNPTGAVYSHSLLKQINDLCASSGLYHISDEVYEYFTFDGAVHVSPAQFDRKLTHTVSLFSCSKAFALSGYRVGFMVIPDLLYDNVLKVQDTIGICAPSLSQLASQASWSIGGSYVHRFNDELNQMRQYCIHKLLGMQSVKLIETKGAYYFFVNLDTSLSSYDVAVRLAEEFGVIVLPGELFDVSYPSLRISYGNCPFEDLKKALDRLQNGLNKIKS